MFEKDSLTFDLLSKQASLNPEKRALVDVVSGREYTYSEFNIRASQIARVLKDQYGIQAGDRVAILVHHCSEFYEVLFACAKINAILIPLNWRLATPELSYILKDCLPSVLIYDGLFADSANTLALEHKCSQIILGSESTDFANAYELLLSGVSKSLFEMAARDSNEAWYILYTSGTTGRPKGVIQTFAMGLVNHYNIGVPIGLSANDVTLNMLPHFHTAGINLYTLPTFIVGGTALIQRTFEADQTLKLLSEDASVYFGVPAVYLMLAQHEQFNNTDFSGVRSWGCGGAPMPTNILELYAKRNIFICQGFGMTETGPTVFFLDQDDVVRKSGSVGKVQSHAKVKIVDENDDEMSVGEVGELLIKGPGVTPGYWRLPDVTKSAFTDDGWLRSGDLARVDEEGFYYIVDRSKDMFISGGENVYPAEVENVLHQHNAVVEAAVIGIDDDKWGEVGLAVVVIKQGHQLQEQVLIDFCAEHLARYKVPKLVVFVDQLPRNASGKVLKPQLREEYGR